MSDLAVSGLCVDRGGRRVLSDVSLTVAAGEALVVSGPNGAGKSTLLRAIVGLCAVADGAVDYPGEIALCAHLVAHKNAVKATETALSNIAFHARILGADAPEMAAEEALAAVGLLALADTPAGYLSQGQTRRLALARLFAAPRPLWLLDEPVAGLDAASRERFAGAMATHLDGGGLVVASTHEPLGLVAPKTLALG
ncbi:MAG: heme ABC exporter ATP-binding protein CcmA [Pseudomonadota bacterium]